jgi:general secretion pathway protein D
MPFPTNRDEKLREIMLRRQRESLTNAAKANVAATLPPGMTVPSAGSPAPAAASSAAAPTAAGADTNAASAILPSPTSARPGSIIVPLDGSQTNNPAAGNNTPPEEMIPAGMINFPAMDLNQVLQVYADLVHRTILRPTTLPAPTITLKTQTELTKREAMQAFDAVLAMNGIAMINVGDKFVKAVPMAQANQEGAAFSKLDPSALPELGQYVTHVVQLKYTKPTEMVQALTPFAKLPNSVLPIDSSGILVLRDYTENVKRMLEMIKEIDVSVPSEFISEVIPIKYALASEIASALTGLSTGGGATSVGKSSTGSATGSRAFGTSAGSTGGAGGMGGMGGQSGYNRMGTSPMGSTGATPSSTGSFSDRLQAIIKRASVSGEIVVLGQTKIIADERTNSLLIFASRDDMKMIKDVVAKLDIVLAQVLIEAVVIEVSLRDELDIGLSYLKNNLHDTDNTRGIGAIGSRPTDWANFATNLSGGFSYLGQFGGDLNVAVKAVASDSRARVLQRPRIQTSHAVEANLFVGESRPYPTSSYYGGGAYGGYSSIQQLQIGVTLSVTPLINPDGLVVMDIHQTIENVNGDVEIANVGKVPVTSRKEAAAKVAVRDRDTIMLGGLIETSHSKGANGVPLLKDVPMIGFLFRSTSTKQVRNELIVLIRPTVLPTPEVAALTAMTEKDKMSGVKRAEIEMREEEAKRLEQTDRYLNNRN